MEKPAGISQKNKEKKMFKKQIKQIIETISEDDWIPVSTPGRGLGSSEFEKAYFDDIDGNQALILKETNSYWNSIVYIVVIDGIISAVYNNGIYENNPSRIYSALVDSDFLSDLGKINKSILAEMPDYNAEEKLLCAIKAAGLKGEIEERIEKKRFRIGYSADSQDDLYRAPNINILCEKLGIQIEIESYRTITFTMKK